MDWGASKKVESSILPITTSRVNFKKSYLAYCLMKIDLTQKFEVV